MKKTISDMYLIATLLALEVPYSEVREQGGGRLQFVFEGDASQVAVLENGVPTVKESVSLDQVESYHASGSLLCSSDRLCSSIRNVKSLIHGYK